MLLMMVIALMLPMVSPVAIFAESECEAEAQDCCQYECYSCCWYDCCEQVTNWYAVSFYDDEHVWVTKYVEMSVIDGEENAAEYFGHRAGYDCFVCCVVGYEDSS